MRQPSELCLKLLILSFRERRVIDLSDLKTQEINLFEPVLLVQQSRLQFAGSIRPPAVCIRTGYFGLLKLLLRKTVHKRQMILRIQ